MYRSRARARASVCGQQNNTNDWKHENIDFREYLVTIWSFFCIQISESPVVTIHRIPMGTTRNCILHDVAERRSEREKNHHQRWCMCWMRIFHFYVAVCWSLPRFFRSMFQNYSVWISISSISLNLREMAILCEKQCYRNSLVHRISRNISRMLASNSMQQMRAHTQHTCLMQANDVTLI